MKPFSSSRSSNKKKKHLPLQRSFALSLILLFSTEQASENFFVRMTRTPLTCSRRWYQKRIENSSPPTVRENTFLRKSHARKCSRSFTDSRHARFHPPPPILEEKACSYYLMAERCLRRWILRRCSGRDKIERRECGEKCAFRKFRDAGKGVAIWEQEIKLNFVKVGEGERGLDASKKRRYRVYLSSLARSMSPFLSPFPLSFALVLPLSCFCSFDPGIFGRMKFGFEVNPLVRNQSRPHRITRVAHGKWLSRF